MNKTADVRDRLKLKIASYENRVFKAQLRIGRDGDATLKMLSGLQEELAMYKQVLIDRKEC